MWVMQDSIPRKPGKPRPCQKARPGFFSRKSGNPPESPEMLLGAVTLETQRQQTKRK